MQKQYLNIFSIDHFRFISHRGYSQCHMRQHTFCAMLNFIYIFRVGKRFENTAFLCYHFSVGVRDCVMGMSQISYFSCLYYTKKSNTLRSEPWHSVYSANVISLNYILLLDNFFFTFSIYEGCSEKFVDNAPALANASLDINLFLFC